MPPMSDGPLGVGDGVAVALGVGGIGVGVGGGGDVGGGGGANVRIGGAVGTGVGSAVFTNGTRLHLELGHHPFHKGKTYEDELGYRTLLKKGKKWWNKRLREAIEDLKIAFNYDRLLLGGGNTKYIRFEPPEDVKIVSNEEGLLGGIKLWQDVDPTPAPGPGARKLRSVKRPT